MRSVIALLVLCSLTMSAAAQSGREQAASDLPANDDEQLSTWRAAFRAAGDEEGLRAFRDLMKESVHEGASGPRAEAYLATAEVMAVGLRANPISKLFGFRKWTGRLDRQVRSAPDDPEVRLLRLAVRANAPSFLGYSRGVEDDCEVVSRAAENAFWEREPEHELIAHELLDIEGLCR